MIQINGQADGWITIKTRLDTEKFDEQAKDLEQKIEQEEEKINNQTQDTTDAIKDLGETSNESFGTMASGLGKVSSATLPAIAGIGALVAATVLLRKSQKLFATTIKTVFAPAIFTITTLAKKLADIVKTQVTKAINELSQKTRQGLDNLTQISDRLNESISSLQNSLTQAGNAMASAVAPVIEAIIPLMNNLLNTVVNTANGIAQVTASLFGNATTFKKAKKSTDDYSKSLAGAGKAAKNALASFDELNVLPSDQGSGAGAGILDMFEDVPIDQKILDFTNKLKELWNANDIKGLENLGKTLGEKVNKQIEELPAYEWAKGIGEKINKALALVNGFLSTNPRKITR